MYICLSAFPSVYIKTVTLNASFHFVTSVGTPGNFNSSLFSTYRLTPLSMPNLVVVHTEDTEINKS